MPFNPLLPPVFDRGASMRRVVSHQTRTRWAGRPPLAALAVILAVAATGCGRLEAETRDDRGEAPAFQQQGTRPVRGEFVFDPTKRQAWADAERYLAGLNFSLAKFPHGDDQYVKLDGYSRTTRLTLVPEANARWLRVRDFADTTRRVIAKAEWGAADALLPPIKRKRPAKVAYLLALNEKQAVWMFNDGGSIGWGPVWEFTANKDADPVAYSMARWWPKEHVHHESQRGVGPRPHITGTWVACFEGCCTAASDGSEVT